MLQRLVRMIEDPAPSHVFEISADGIAWASDETLGFQALAPGALTISPIEDNIRDEEAISLELRRLAAAPNSSKKRRPCALILPDYCARITVLDFDSFPSNPEEQASLVRFRMKKSLPFDADSAAVQFQSQAGDGGRQEVVVGAISLEILSRYESVFRRAGWHPGFVTISSLAAMELIDKADGIVLAARMSGTVLTLSLLKDGVLRLARCVELSAPEFEEAAAVVFPTIAYAEDEFGSPISAVRHCGFDEFRRGWQDAFSVPLEPLQSRWKTPGGRDAGMLGYLKATKAA